MRLGKVCDNDFVDAFAGIGLDELAKNSVPRFQRMLQLIGRDADATATAFFPPTAAESGFKMS